MANVPGNKGGLLWENAMQSQTPPAQPAIPLITGGPQGVVYAPIGAVCVDETGALWVKGSDGSVNTGWKTATLT